MPGVVLNPYRPEASSKVCGTPTDWQAGGYATGMDVDAVDPLCVEIRDPERAESEGKADWGRLAVPLSPTAGLPAGLTVS